MISVELSNRFRKIVRDAHREAEVSATLKKIIKGFGNPHEHSGLSIRKLGKQLYECRTSLRWRLVLFVERGILTFDFAGDHDEVRSYLRARH